MIQRGGSEFPISEGSTQGLLIPQSAPEENQVPRRAWARWPPSSTQYPPPPRLSENSEPPGQINSTIIHLTKGFFTLQKTSPQGSFEGHSCSTKPYSIYTDVHAHEHRTSHLPGAQWPQGRKQLGTGRGTSVLPHPQSALAGCPRFPSRAHLTPLGGYKNIP